MVKQKMSNNIAIIYLHGFASGYHRDNFEDLKRHGFNVYNPSYEPHDAIKTMEYMDKYINDIKHKYAQIIIIGNSLGGLWADYYGRLYKVPIILINPLVNVYRSLSELVEEHQSIIACEKFTINQKYMDDIGHKYARMVIACKSIVEGWIDESGRSHRITTISDNQSIKIYHSLMKLLIDYLDESADDKFAIAQKHIDDLNSVSIKTHNMPKTDTHLLINLDDEVLNPNYAIDEFKDQPTIKHAGGGHRIMRHHEILSICHKIFIGAHLS